MNEERYRDACSILYEDAYVIVACKNAPVPVQSGKDGGICLEAIVRELTGSDMAEAAHRVDQRASGAVLLARNAEAKKALDEAFRARKIEKTYVACVGKKPDPALSRLEHDLVWDPKRQMAKAFPPGSSKSGKRSSLTLRAADSSERYFFLEISLETGRPHQIRAQLKAIGCPIRGDVKYGFPRTTANGLIMLHARRIAFAHPVSGKRIEVVAPFPESEPLWAECRTL